MGLFIDEDTVVTYIDEWFNFYWYYISLCSGFNFVAI